ncbi:hypothetical protein [Peribacillus sp. NPDC055009]
MLEQIINKLINDLSQVNWDSYTKDQKISKLREVMGHLKNVFRIEGPISLSFPVNQRGGSYVYRRREHLIEIGQLDFDSSKESVDNLAHELFHAMQMERIDEFNKVTMPNEIINQRILQLENPFIKEWIKNKKDGYIEPTLPWWQFWISSKKQYSKYRNQPIERDAWENGEKTAKKLTVPISLKKSLPSFFDSIMQKSQIPLSEENINVIEEFRKNFKNDDDL